MSIGIKNINIKLNDDAWGALFSHPFTWLCIRTNPKSLGSRPCLPYADGVEHALCNGDRALSFGWHLFCLHPTPFFLIPIWLQLLQFRSVQFSHSVVSDSLQPHELQHTRPPCASPTPRVHSNSHPSSQWCRPAISSSVVPFSSAPNPCRHQSLFQWVNSSYEVAKVLEFQL